MKLTTHGNNLLQLTHAGWVDCYLVREDDGFTLIDAVDTADWAPQIMQAAQSLGLPSISASVASGGRKLVKQRPFCEPDTSR